MKKLTQSFCKSPIGDIQLLHADGKLCYLEFADNPERMHTLMQRRFGDYEIIQDKKDKTFHAELGRYFAGDKNAFKKIPLDTGGTDFQQTVWQCLQKIPYGKTEDYSTLATQAGNPKATRAAASSNARNPISIIIPCHRVIGKDGSLRGYAGGEDRKAWLLNHEGAAFKTSA